MMSQLAAASWSYRGYIGVTLLLDNKTSINLLQQSWVVPACQCWVNFGDVRLQAAQLMARQTPTIVQHCPEALAHLP